MVQRIFEIATGVCAAVSGWLLLYMIFFANTVGGPNGSYNYVSHYRDLSWLPAFVAFAAALTVIALGALLHSVLSFSQNGRHAHPVFSLLGVVALWLATAVLMVMIILAGLSIGLVFIPSAVLALIACVLALIPGLRSRSPGCSSTRSRWSRPTPQAPPPLWREWGLPLVASQPLGIGTRRKTCQRVRS